MPVASPPPVPLPLLGRVRPIVPLPPVIPLPPAVAVSLTMRPSCSRTCRFIVAATEAMGSWWLQHPEEPKELQVLRLMNIIWMGFGDLLEGRLWIPPAGAFGPGEEETPR